MAETTAEIVYSGTDWASVHFATSATGDVARAAELALFGLYAGHIFADIGRKAWAQEFSSALGGMNEDEGTAFAASGAVLGVRVNPAADGPGEPLVGFGAWLFHDDEVRARILPSRRPEPLATQSADAVARTTPWQSLLHILGRSPAPSPAA